MHRAPRCSAEQHSALAPSLVGSSNSINLRVRVTAAHGLLLWAGQATDFVAIGVTDGVVEVSQLLG